MQLIQQHVGPQEHVVVGGTSIPLHAAIHRMLLSLWHMEKCWSNNKIGGTNKEVESYRRGMVEEYTTFCGGLSASSCLAAPHGGSKSPGGGGFVIGHRKSKVKTLVPRQNIAAVWGFIT